MKLDLRSQNIVSLSFDSKLSAEERAVASSVCAIDASENHITLIRGLHTTFGHLSEMILSHNNLGEQHLPPSLQNRNVLCSGIAPWMEALPSTLRILDVSSNIIPSLLSCSCGGAVKPSASPSDLETRKLRHVTPNAVSLFFSKARFPSLETLVLANNAFQTTPSQCQAEEKQWNEISTSGWSAESSVEVLDVSHNKHVSSVNSFLFTSSRSSPLKVLNLEGCNIEDLHGLSAVAYYAPQLKSLRLKSSPIEDTLRNARGSSRTALLANVLLSFTPPSLASGDQRGRFTEVSEEVANNRCEELESYLGQFFQSRGAADSVYSLGTCIYAVLIQLVVQTFPQLDGCYSTSLCREGVRVAFHQTLQNLLSCGPSGSVELRVAETVTNDSKGDDSKDDSSHYNGATEEGKSEVSTSKCSDESTIHSCAVVSMSTNVYVENCKCCALLEESKNLERAIEESKQSTRRAMGVARSLEAALLENRSDIRAQRKQLLSLQDEEAGLKQSILTERQRLRKCQLTQSYSAAARESRMRRLAKPTPSLHTPQRNSHTVSRQRAQCVTREKVRSEIFRQRATREKLQTFQMEHPFLYAPSRFRNRCDDPRSTMPYGSGDSVLEPTHSPQREVSPSESPCHTSCGEDRFPAEQEEPLCDVGASLVSLTALAAETQKRQLELRDIRIRLSGSSSTPTA